MARVTYNISGKYDGKAMKSAQSGVQSLAASFTKASAAAVALMATKALGGIKKLVDGSTDSFLKQNSALINYDKAIKKASLSLTAMNGLKTELSRGNFFTDDDLNNTIALISDMGLAEEQIRDVMTAATDMAAKGVMPLDTAVKQLTATYSGASGTLGKISPQVKELTKEQLANGEAVKILKQQYAGYADLMANSFSGRDTQFKNVFGDLKNEVGAIVQSFKFISQGSFLQPIQKMTQYLNTNRENIIKFVLALPDMSKAALNGIREMVRETFTGQGLTNLLQFVGSSFINSFKAALDAAWTLTKGIVETIKNFLDVTIGNVFRLINNKFLDMGNNLIEIINKALSKVLDSKAVKWIAENIFKTKGFDGSNVISFRFSEKEYTTFDTFVEKEKNIITSAVKGYKDAVSSFVQKEGKLLDKSKGIYEQSAKTMKDNILAAYNNTDLPSDLQQAMTNGAATVQNSIEEGFDNADSSAGNNTTTGSDASEGKSPFTALLGSLGQIGEAINAFISGSGPIGLLIMLVTEIITQLSSSSEIISKAFNFMSYFVSMFIEPLAEIVEETVVPILNVLRILGAVVAKLLKIFQPVISVLLIPLKGILQAVAIIITGIYNAVVAVHNLFSSRRNKWDYMSVSDVRDSDSLSLVETATSNTSSGSNSVTAARDVYVYITYNQSYVNGDARMIALNIRDEIRRAEKLGY